MARFILYSIDHDQTGFGAWHAVPELQRQLPVTATLTRQIPGADRDDYFLAVLDTPVKYHPTAQFDWARCQPELIATDADGQFVWIYAVIIASLSAGTQIHAGMKGFAVRVAYVLDNTVVDNTAGHDEQLDFGKCDSVGYGSIDDVEDAAEPNQSRGH